MSRETELGFKIKRVLGKDDQWGKIVKETEEFYDRLESNPAEIDLGDIKSTIVQLQQLRSEYNKINNDVSSNRGQIEFAQTLYTALDRAEDKFASIGVMFKNVNDNTRRYVTGLSNITTYLADSNFGVKFLDVGAQFEELQGRAKELFNTLKLIGTGTYDGYGDFSLKYGDFYQHELEERIDLLEQLKSIQEDMLQFDSSLRAKDLPTGFNNDDLDEYIEQGRIDLQDLEDLNLATTRQLETRRTLIKMLNDDTWDSSDQEDARKNIMDDEYYEQSIEDLQSYIDAKRNLILEFQEYEDELFSQNTGIDKYVGKLETQISTYEGYIEELQNLRNNNKNGDTVFSDFSEVVDALNEIRDSIREIKEAFDPLTKAFSNEESAIHAMVTSNVSQLEELINKFKEVHDMVDSLNKKEFNITNVTQSVSEKTDTSNFLDTYQTEAKRLLKLISQINDEILGAFGNTGLSAFGIDKSVLNKMFDLARNEGQFKKDIDKAKGLASVQSIYEELYEQYLQAVFRASNKVNEHIPGFVNISNLDKIKNVREMKELISGGLFRNDIVDDVTNDAGTDVDTNKVLTQIQTLGQQVQEEFKSIRQQIEATFDFSTIDPDLTNIQSITDQIYQQFVELQTNIKALDFGIVASDKNAETTSGSNSAVDVDTIKNSLLELEQVTGKTLASVIQEYDSLDVELKSKVDSILKYLGLMNDNSEFLFESMRGGNAKAFVSDNFVILQKALDMSYDELQLFVNKLQEAEKEGIQVASVLGQVQSTLSSDNFGYEIQQRASGSNIHETQKELIDLNRALHENQVILGASSDQLQKFISDYIKLGELGIEIDPSKTSNFLYDAEKGFSFIDLRLQRVNAEAKTTEILFREITSVLANTAGFNKLGQDVNIGESSGAIIAHVASAFKNLGLATDVELEKLVQERYDGFGNLYEGYLKEQSNIAKSVQSAIDAIKQEGEVAEQTTPKKDAFTAANQKLADSMKETGDVGKVATDGIEAEADAAEKAAQKIAQSAKKIRADQDTIVDKYVNLYGGSGKINPDLASRFNAVLDKAGIDVSSIKASFGIKTYKDEDNNVIEYDYIRLIAEGTDALGKATTETREYEVATGGLIKKMASFKEVKDTFNVAQEVENANSKVAELEKRMGSFKIDLTEVKAAAKNITDDTSLDIFEKALESANQKLKELKATLKSSKSLDPIVNSEGMMSNLEKTVETYRENIKKFSDVDGFGKLEEYLSNITTHLNAFNEAKEIGNGKTMAESVAAANKEIAAYNAQLNLVNAKYRENSALMKEIAAEDKLTLNKDNQLSLLIKQQAQWEKYGQLTDEVRAKINDMLESLTKVTSADELVAWKTQWSIVKNEVATTKLEIESAAKAKKEIDAERHASGSYWSSAFKESLSGLITPEKRPELDQIKSYMLQQAEETKKIVEEQYNAIMRIISAKNAAIGELMSAKGPNDKQRAQDNYSAWYGAWSALGKNTVSEFFSNTANQAMLGEEKIIKFNKALEESEKLSARMKDQDIAIASQEAVKQKKQALAEEKALMKDLVADDKFTLDLEKQLSLLIKQQAQWKANGQLTDSARQKIDEILESLSKVADATELAMWKKQWSIVKDEVLATKYEIKAAANAQKEISSERKVSGAYWDKEFKYSLDNLIAPETRPELEQIKAYMLQQAEEVRAAVEERYNAIMDIVSKKNSALQKLMSADGEANRQNWQDQYSAWFGAWKALDQNDINEFFFDAGNQAILGAKKIEAFNKELEKANDLDTKRKDREASKASRDAEQQRRQALAEEKALIAEEKALMQEIVSDEKFALDKDNQFAMLSKQQAQWKKNGQLTDEVNKTINSMLDSLANVSNSDELTIWRKQWSIVKNEVLATKHEIDAVTKAQKATANERKASKTYWDKEFQYSLNNIITPESRPELEQLKVYMLQQAKMSQDAIEEQYDAIFTIIKKKNDSLAKLMSADGPNDKQYWQDEYSAWFGAWNKLDSDVVSNFFADAGNQAILGAGKIEKFNEELERAKILENKNKDNDYNKQQQEQDKINKEKQKYGQTDYNRLNKFSESLQASIRELQKDSSVSATLNSLVAEFDETYTKIEGMRKQFNDDPSSVTPELKAQFQDSVHYADNLRQKITEVFKESQKLQKTGDLVGTGKEDVSQLNDLKSAMISFAGSALDGEVKVRGFNKEGTQMYATLNDGTGELKNITVALDGATGRLHAFNTGTSVATNEWEDFTKQVASGAKNIVGMYVGFQEGVQAARQGVEYVKEIDLAMTELKKVTDETDASYKQFLKDAGSAAAVVGSTIRDFTEATATFARLGYSMEEASSMAETAIIYKNVADGLDSVEESSDSIISTMMAFGIEADDTMSIIDRFNAVGNSFAITSAGIGEALQRSASALYEAGNTIDESVALVTAANSVIQNPEQVGELIAHQHSNMLLANSYIG